MNPPKLLKENEYYQKTAKKLLQSSGLTKLLSKYGKVSFCGSYAAGLMMHGDIDIRVIREKPFQPKEVLKILGELYFKTDFKSYFIGGDWDNPKLGKEFPKGRYIGLKQKIKNEAWKIDIWFIDKKEAARLNKVFDITQARVTEEQKMRILDLKMIKKERKSKISSQEIYLSVIRGMDKKVIIKKITKE